MRSVHCCHGKMKFTRMPWQSVESESTLLQSGKILNSSTYQFSFKKMRCFDFAVSAVLLHVYPEVKVMLSWTVIMITWAFLSPTTVFHCFEVKYSLIHLVMVRDCNHFSPYLQIIHTVVKCKGMSSVHCNDLTLSSVMMRECKHFSPHLQIIHTVKECQRCPV